MPRDAAQAIASELVDPDDRLGNARGLLEEAGGRGGILLYVGELRTLGYLPLGSAALYGGMEATVAKALIGRLSALADNVPVTSGVLSMNQGFSEGQWPLITLTVGVGGSLLSVGSAGGWRSWARHGNLLPSSRT